jgi:hypothetical protein
MDVILIKLMVLLNDYGIDATLIVEVFFVGDSIFSDIPLLSRDLAKIKNGLPINPDVLVLLKKSNNQLPSFQNNDLTEFNKKLTDEMGTDDLQRETKGKPKGATSTTTRELREFITNFLNDTLHY